MFSTVPYNFYFESTSQAIECSLEGRSQQNRVGSPYGPHMAEFFGSPRSVEDCSVEDCSCCFIHRIPEFGAPRSAEVIWRTLTNRFVLRNTQVLFDTHLEGRNLHHL